MNIEWWGETPSNGESRLLRRRGGGKSGERRVRLLYVTAQIICLVLYIVRLLGFTCSFCLFFIVLLFWSTDLKGGVWYPSNLHPASRPSLPVLIHNTINVRWNCTLNLLRVHHIFRKLSQPVAWRAVSGHDKGFYCRCFSFGRDSHS